MIEWLVIENKTANAVQPLLGSRRFFVEAIHSLNRQPLKIEFKTWQTRFSFGTCGIYIEKIVFAPDYKRRYNMTVTEFAVQDDATMSRQSNLNTLARTKTVATIGPASSSEEQLAQLIKAGVDVFRLNMAHGDLEMQQQNLDRIRAASRVANVPVAVLVDISGPKIRLGQLAQDPFRLRAGETVRFVPGEHSDQPYDLVTNYPKLLKELEPGDTVMLTDGTVRLEVVEITDTHASCKVIDGGTVRSRQGVNLPGVKLSVPAMDDEDKEHAIWGAQNGADFISLSFVRTPHEVEELKQMLRDLGSHAHVIAKIEKREAMEQLEAIVDAADGIMVARGDLGVEIDIAQTALAQKRIIHVCRQYGKPVIVATQMLESMHHSQRPTRAEVSDVSNAILDGADACMLSGETAIGDYPVEAVKMMQRIMVETEKVLQRQPSRSDRKNTVELDVSQAVVYGAAQIASRADAKLVILTTGSSKVLLAKSKQRDFIPSACLTDSTVYAQRACLYWGIYPILTQTPTVDPEAVRKTVLNWLEGDPSVKTGDLMIIVSDQATAAECLDTIVLERV